REIDNQLEATGERKASFNAFMEELPLISFTLDGRTTRDTVVRGEQWSTELPNGTVQGARTQDPLTLVLNGPSVSTGFKDRPYQWSGLTWASCLEKSSVRRKPSILIRARL
ncbi:hypothetical protein EDD11_008907, partial [Mortierella claussenii]